MATPSTTKSLPWTVICQGTKLTQADASTLDQFEYIVKSNTAATSYTLDDSAPEIISSVIKVVDDISDPQAITRALSLIQSILQHGPPHSVSVVNRFLEKKDFFNSLLVFMEPETNLGFSVGSKTAAVVGLMLGSRPVEKLDTDPRIIQQKEVFFRWICDNLDLVTSTNIDESTYGAVLTALSNSLRTETNRLYACEKIPKAIEIVASFLDPVHHHRVQLVYQSIFVLWLLSFSHEEKVMETVFRAMENAQIPRRLAVVLREISAEKVVRISLATLANFGKISPRLRGEMVGAGLSSTFEQLVTRRWTDQDIRNDLAKLNEELASELTNMSTFEVYRNEVLSGALEWTPVHKDQLFWKENVEKLERNNMEVLRCIVKIIKESTDPLILSVACYDLAQFIKNHPRGRYIIQKLEVKAKLMELMHDPNMEVRRYALNCVQVLMISHWDMIAKA